MATIQTSIQMADGISSTLSRITNALNLTVGAFQNVYSTANQDLNVTSFEAIRNEINAASIAIRNMGSQLDNVHPEPFNVSVQPVWNTQSHLEVFDGAGLDRFQQEIQSANDMMNRLAASQQQIQNQAANTSLFPANMVSDITNMNSRIDRLRTAIQRVQDNPLSSLGADQVNDEVEKLRQQLNQALSEQEALNDAMQNLDISAANNAYEKLNSIVDSTDRYIRDNIDEQGTFNRLVEDGGVAADNLAGKIKGFISAFAGIAAIKSSIGWIQDSLDLSNVQINAEKQLANVLGNVGATVDEFNVLKDVAASIQGYTLYGDESMIGGAAELATYISDIDALQSMMGTLSNYAAGMSGGGEVGYQQMVEYATQLGKALDGTFDGITKKGFELSDAQKKIIENGTDMEKALVMDEVISQSWNDLAAAMANTPEGKIIQMQNAFGDIREEIGMRLYLAVLSLFDTIQSHMPQIEQVLFAFATGVQYIIYAIQGIIEVASVVYKFFVNNWSMIAPVIFGIVAALAAYGLYLAITNGIELVSKGIKLAACLASYAHAAATGTEASATAVATAAQYGLNTALLACPLTWIIIAIIALIALVYIVVAAVNKFAGTSVSATGIIFGAFAVLGAFLWDLFLGLLELVFGIINAMVNPFIKIANFIGNVFTNPISSIIYLFQGMADGVLAILEKIASAFDFVFGSSMADAVAGWRSGLKDMADAAVAKYAPNENYQNVMDELDLSVESVGLSRWAYGDAWETGYQAGENLEDSFSNFDPASLFDQQIPGAEDYLSGMTGNTGNIADNTASMDKSLSMGEEDLKYLCDIAERDVINRFTTAELKVDFTAKNEIKSDLDLDGVVSYLEDKVTETLEAVAEGVHE